MMANKNGGGELLRLGEVCRRLNLRYSTAWEGVTGGSVPAVRLSGRWYVRETDLPLVAAALGVDVEAGVPQ